jgi:ABC-type Fe2+-enterobactin transport system substrate-binding protein
MGHVIEKVGFHLGEFPLPVIHDDSKDKRQDYQNDEEDRDRQQAPHLA